MTPLNYVNLSVGSGFFIGLILSVLGAKSPLEILFWTISLCVIFYLLGLFFVGIYLKIMKPSLSEFDKTKIDSILNELDLKFVSKEREFRQIKDEIEIFSQK